MRVYTLNIFSGAKLGSDINGGYLIEPGSTEVAFHLKHQVEGLKDETLVSSVSGLPCLMSGRLPGFGYHQTAYIALSALQTMV